MNPPPNQEADQFRELERARHAVASVWNACWKLLDGPFATHLLRCASLHRVPFTRKDASNPPVAGQSPNEATPAIAGWEPLGKIEAVLADLAASVSGGLDRTDSEVGRYVPDLKRLGKNSISKCEILDRWPSIDQHSPMAANPKACRWGVRGRKGPFTVLTPRRGTMSWSRFIEFA